MSMHRVVDATEYCVKSAARVCVCVQCIYHNFTRDFMLANIEKRKSGAHRQNQVQFHVRINLRARLHNT